ncbi:unnamed protein product [Rotaria sp. Silwood2]|nr:unnamed protein product [Rotaria sp. Silwood2]
MDLASYLHLQSPSGLIDAYDIESLCCFSLAQQGVSNRRVELRQYARKLISTLDSTVGILVERGLSVFGFQHLLFQEYFVAQHILRGDSLDEIAERILSCIVQPRFRQSIILALSWLSWKWSFDKYDRFCHILLTPTTNDSIPFGALIFFHAINDIRRLPSNSTIFTGLNTLLDHPSNILTRQYLLPNLSKLSEDIATEWMQSYLTDTGRLSKFCKSFLQAKTTIDDEFGLFDPKLISPVICRQLQCFYNINQSNGFFIDQILRRRLIFEDGESDDIFKEEFCSHLLKQNISSSDIHPLILSLIAALCNGMVFKNEDNVVKVCFSPDKMFRGSSVLPSILNYFKNNKQSHVIKVRKLIQYYESILEKSSPNDIFLDTVDTFIAYICLNGLLEPSIYKKLHRMESYVLILFWKQHHTNRFDNNDRSEFLNTMKNNASFDQSWIDAPEDWKQHINADLQRISEAKDMISTEAKSGRMELTPLSILHDFLQDCPGEQK